MSFENLTESISSLIQSTTTRCKENPQVTGIIVACAGIWITSKMYRIYRKNRLHDEEYETTNVDTPRARRLIFAKHFGPKLKFEGVTITEEYVQAPDGRILFTRCYVPKDTENIKGMICYNHGYSDHLDNTLYDIAMEFSSKRNFIFFSHEHYGNGRSDGLYAYCPDFMIYVKHSSFLFKRAKLKYSKLYKIPTNSYFIGGTSMGGAVTIHQSIYDENNINININDKSININIPKWTGMFLAAPMCAVDETLRPPKIIEIAFEHLIVPLFPKICGVPIRDMLPYLLSPECDESIRNRVLIDNPMLTGRKPRFLSAKTFLDETRFIEKNAHLVKLPLIVLHSKLDKVTNPDSSKNFVKNAASVEKKLIMYDKGWHMIWSDVLAEQVFDDVENWMIETSNKLNLQ